MNRGTLRQRIESALQDTENRHWTDTDINGYINDAQREFVRITKQPTTTATLSIGPASDKAGTIAVDGRTITGTSSSHGFSVGDAIYFTGFAPVTEYDDQTFIVRAEDTNTFTCVLEQTQAGSTISDASGSFRKVGPTFSKPSTISEINSVSLDGVELEILSESEINSIAYREGGDRQLVDGQLGLIPNPFDNKLTGSFSIPKWRDVQGEVQAVVMTHRTAGSFRIYPVPYQVDQMYIDDEANTLVSDLTPTPSGAWGYDAGDSATYTHTGISQTSTTGSGIGMLCNIVTNSSGNPTFTITNSGGGYAKDEVVRFTDPGSSSNYAELTVTTTKVFKDFEIRGVVDATNIASDSTSPQIHEIWQEALIFGALDRAYLKETNLRNVEKSVAWKSKFDAVAQECRRTEGINSASYGGGRNESRMRIAR